MAPKSKFTAKSGPTSSVGTRDEGKRHFVGRVVAALAQQYPHCADARMTPGPRLDRPRQDVTAAHPLDDDDPALRRLQADLPAIADEVAIGERHHIAAVVQSLGAWCFSHHWWSTGRMTPYQAA